MQNYAGFFFSFFSIPNNENYNNNEIKDDK